MMPTTISLHPQGGIVAHYPDRQVPLSQMTAEERYHILAEMVSRYNHGEDALEGKA